MAKLKKEKEEMTESSREGQQINAKKEVIEEPVQILTSES